MIAQRAGWAVAALLAAAVVWLFLDRRSVQQEVERLRAAPPRVKLVEVPAPPPEPAPAPQAVEPPPRAPKAPETPAPAPSLEKANEALKALLEADAARKAPSALEVAALQAKACDRAADPKERLAALQRLRGTDPDGRSLEVVRSMIDLLRTSPDGRIRADICRQLHKVMHEELKQALLATARTDGYPKAREEAAESLGPWAADDPHVRQALEALLASDPDADVRQQARRSLERRR